jgi:hypothetical protein
MAPIAWYQVAAPILVCVAVVAVAVRVPRYRFALYGLVAVVGYAILQDQVSARLCPDYFTVLHPPIPNCTNPTLLGVCWGFLGGWWGGIVMGYAAGLVSTLGPRPPLAPRDFVTPLLVCMCGVGTVTALCGISVWQHANMFGVSLDRVFDGLIPEERQRAALVVACYHFVSYAASTLGGVVVCVYLWAERRKRDVGRGE